MKSMLAAVAALGVATPAAAGYRFVTIDGPASPSRQATIVDSINAAGVASGYRIDDDGFGGPGIYTGFTVNADGSNYTSFSRPGFAQTGFSEINDAGDIAGVSVTAQGFGTGFVRSGTTGAYTDIFPAGLGAIYAEAIGLNNTGAVAGYYVTDPAATVATLAQYARGFVEVGGVDYPIDVDPAIGYGTQINSINDAGLFTGDYLGLSDGLQHPFVGQLNPLDPAASPVFAPLPDPFGAPSSSIGNITANGLTTYDSIYPSAMSPIGFVSAAFVVDIATLGFTPVNVPGAFFTDIFEINAARQITGFYLDPTGLHGFVGTFVPEPGTWSLMIAGFGLVGRALRRRTRVATQG